MIKRITALFLVFIFIYNSVGYYFLFKIEQYQIKEEIKTKIKNSAPQSQLILITFHPSSEEFKTIDWVENHEFRYKGEMYDILHETIGECGIIHYYCVNDEQEERLFGDLDKHIKNHVSSNENQSDTKKNSYGKIIKDYFLPDDSSYFLKVDIDLIRFHIPFLLTNASGTITTPPPDKV